MVAAVCKDAAALVFLCCTVGGGIVLEDFEDILTLAPEILHSLLLPSIDPCPPIPPCDGRVFVTPGVQIE